MTTTSEGKTVPYLVKVESGTINRTIYRIATLEGGYLHVTGVVETLYARWQELVTGGATRTIFGSMTLPVLMSH